MRLRTAEAVQRGAGQIQMGTWSALWTQMHFLPVDRSTLLEERFWKVWSVCRGVCRNGCSNAQQYAHCCCAAVWWMKGADFCCGASGAD